MTGPSIAESMTEDIDAGEFSDSGDLADMGDLMDSGDLVDSGDLMDRGDLEIKGDKLREDTGEKEEYDLGFNGDF